MRLITIAAAAACAIVAFVSVAVGSEAGRGDCDRECLKRLADTYIDALVAHDASRAPLASDIRIVENVKRIRPGEGLWKTASAGPTTFKIYVPDTVAQQVGFIGVMQSDGKPIMLGLRLKRVNGKIGEAEHLVVSNLREASLATHLQKPRAPLTTPVPEPYRDSRSRLIYIAERYYDALDLNNGSLAPFADDCVRFENGVQSTRNPVPADPFKGTGLFGAFGCAKQLDTQFFEYITAIDNRRVWIADEETGLAFGLSHFRHAMDRRTFPVFGVPGQEMRKMDNQPFDMPAVHVFKIWGGEIHEIEALGIVAPYRSPTGWED
jgi:hypothetical protein